MARPSSTSLPLCIACHSELSQLTVTCQSHDIVTTTQYIILHAASFLYLLKLGSVENLLFYEVSESF